MFRQLEEEEKEEDIEDEIPEDSIIVNGDINIEIHDYNVDEGFAKKIKNTTTRVLRNRKVKSTWKNKVRKRDDYICQCCKKKFKQHLEVHHIMPFSQYPHMGDDLGNGISLCQKCHAKYHDVYKGRENAVTFAKFLRDEGKK